ncbi:pathogenesis-related protein PRB1-3-like [Canna indica]|uniref:Pathogenesis-related protein PRB1-3-like n=1 Tax=Canna indica TaxID=4628 RepID=A0AAQ3K1W2_9LILI|nr:pathogenesis-related protein PRB1-3-like [Canna indica]
MGLAEIAGICALLLLLLPTIEEVEAVNSMQDFLHAHNAVRASLGVRPLSWSADMEAYARRYARRRRPDCELVHSAGPYGENIFEGSAGYTPTYAVGDWVSEREFYDYSANSCAAGETCGHYTQVVWAKSRFLGCAQVVCADGDIFITCNYDPPGNVDGELPY